jgi:hypothetical protein
MAILDAQQLLNETSFKQCTFKPMSTSAVFRSVHNRSRQKAINQYAEWWNVTVQLVAGTQATHRAWTGYLAGLNWREHTVLFGDISATAPLGSASSTPGTPVIDGTPTLGSHELSIRGCPTSKLDYLYAGDWIQVGSGATSRLHKITKTVITNLSGEATLDIWPSFKEAASDGDPITLTNPRGLFELQDSYSPEWTVGRGGVIQPITFTLTEID